MSDQIQIVRASAGDISRQWKSQYCEAWQWRSVVSGSALEIYRGIQEAGDDLDKIDVAIGNNSWTHFRCAACGNSVREIVQMLEPDYETTPYFCGECILKAAKLWKQRNRKPTLK